MKPLRAMRVLALLPVLAVGLAWPAFAQQGRQRRVFTNEDVARPAASAPAAEPAATPASEPGEAKAPAAEGASAEAAPARSVISDPKIELKTILELQGVLKNAIQLFSEKEELETKPDLKTRWHNMAANMTTVFLEAQRTVNELQKQIGEPEGAPAAPPGSTQSPAPPTP